MNAACSSQAVDHSPDKPRLTFFRFRHARHVPSFMLLHQNEQVSCLSQFFTVTVVSEDGDFEQICEQTRADIALLETGLETPSTRRLKLRNVRNVNTIPKVAFLNSDGCSELRSSVLSDIENWRTHCAFTISAVAADHLHGAIPNLFVWPNFVDASVFRDYALPKIVPVLLTGSLSSRYPWRRRVYPRIAENFPAMSCPHPGYAGATRPWRTLSGEPYARAMNAAMVVPTCGSVTHEVVRKHLEIPASRACLVTEQTSQLEAAGFVDMVNCVFVDESTVVERLDFLLEHPQRLQEITDSGFALAHARHTMRNRTQLHDWYSLHSRLPVGSRIVQRTPFAPVEVEVDAGSAAPSTVRTTRGRHLQLVDDGYGALASGDLEAAECRFRNALQFLSELPEAKIGIALSRLRAGDAQGSLEWLVAPLKTNLVRYRAESPDPAEWAYLVIAMLALGRTTSARRRARQFAHLNHEGLNAVRAIVASVLPERSSPEQIASSTGVCSQTIHHKLPRSRNEWLQDASEILAACGQPDIATLARSLATQGDPRPVARSDTGVRQIDRLAFRPTLSGLDSPDLWPKLASRLRRAWDEAVSKVTRGSSAGARRWIE